MGSLAVLTMAEDVNCPDHAGRRPLHPFFMPTRVAAPIADRLEVNNASNVNEAPDKNEAPESSSSPKGYDETQLPFGDIGSERAGSDAFGKSSGRRTKRRKTDGDQDEDEDKKKPRAKRRARPSVGGGIASHFIKPSTGTRDSPRNDDGLEDEHEETSLSNRDPRPDQHVGSSGEDRSLNPLPDSMNNSLPRSQTTHAVAEDAPKPKKLLQFNPKTGTIGSPPKRKQPQIDEGKTGARGKKECPKGENIPRTKVVVIQYGTDSESRIRVSARIEAILRSQPPSLTPTMASSPQPDNQENQPLGVSQSATPKRPKTTHPFFLGKARKPESVTSQETKTNRSEPSPAKTSMKQFSSTPCSPKRPRAGQSSVRLPQFGMKNPTLKFPGSKLPAWPWEGMVHVRGDGAHRKSISDVLPLLPLRKSKGHAVKISSSESIIEFITRGLDIPGMAEAVRNVNNDEFLPAPPELRLPQKHFESGRKLQARIVLELKTIQSSLTTKKAGQRKQLADSKDIKNRPPPQLARLFDSISSGLSAFDQSQCETSNWVQKYAPASAIEVLQQGQEPFLLRDWLQALMVQSVDTGAADSDKPKAGSKSKASGVGKKKRRKRLDGFIVSSDDEDYEMYTLSDDEADWVPSGSQGNIRKTVVRSSDLSKSKEGEKIANTLIISGPHGCGKTAAVYAVAKELGFEVFEINPSSRRSGKDVIEKIGDMTRNHLVRRHPSGVQPEKHETTAAENDLAEDIKTGKQATMNTFFKPKDTASVIKKQVKATTGQRKDIKKDSPKSQRQSLILLEEADILYEEDKQFWATVTSLITQSKRPFVITCNDETLLPWQSLKLHGIFRLTPPPLELAIDRLILVAGNEGHALTRQAVETLYESRNQDLRAATMDLQYWCQIGVGDRRGGFDWFYPRWPKGVDLDENNDVVRVVSQATYRTGMNWLGRDSIVDPKVSPRLVEEELLLQSWENWELDVGHWQDSVRLSSWAGDMNAITTKPRSQLETLEAFDHFAEAMSVADICGWKFFAAFKEEPLDPTLPDVPAKTRDDFILGLVHLDTPCLTHYDSLPTTMASTLKSLARSSLRARTETFYGTPISELQPLSESRAINCIRNSFTSVPGTPAVTRIDFAFAFDPIAVSDSSTLQPVSYLDPSVFDRTLKLIALDVAPYVRGIVAHESRLQKQRLKLSNLMSEGGRAAQGSKRMRTTRAALSALEGGSRSTTRGERWFMADINPHLVMKTAGEGWIELCVGDTETLDNSLSSSPNANPQASPSPEPPESSSDVTPISASKVPKKVTRRGRPRKKVVKDDSADELGEEGDTSCM